MPYYWAGCKVYDLLAGSGNLESSYFLSGGKALEAFPMLKAPGLCGALVYYDGASGHRHRQQLDHLLIARNQGNTTTRE